MTPTYPSFPPSPLPHALLLSLGLSRAGYSHHIYKNFITGLYYTAIHKSMIGKVVIYCADMFWRREIYTPISSSPAVASDSTMGEYTHVPFSWCLGTMPAIPWTPQWWNLVRVFFSRGVTTYISNPNKSTA